MFYLFWNTSYQTQEVDEEEEGKEEATYIDEGELLPFLYSKPHKVRLYVHSCQSFP